MKHHLSFPASVQSGDSKQSGTTRRLGSRKAVQAVLTIVLMVHLAPGGPARAALSHWDANGNAAGAGDTPNGTWGVDSYWSADTNGTTATTGWTSGNSAVFSAGTDATNPFTVFISGTQVAKGLYFEEGAPTLTGGTIVLGAAPFPVVTDVNATIDSGIFGPGMLTKTGSGTLTLNGSNTFFAAMVVSNGVLAVGHSSALGTTTAGTTIHNGAALEISGGIALAEPITMYGSGLPAGFLDYYGAVRNLSGSNYIASLQMDPAIGQAGLIRSEAGTLTLGRVDAGGQYTLTINGNGDTIVSGAEPSHGLYWGGMGGGLRKLDGGTLTIDGLVTIRSEVTLDYEATLRMGADHRFGNAGGVYPDMKVYGVWDLNGFSEIIDGLYGNATITNHGTSTLVMGTNGTYTPYYTSVPIFWGSLHGNTTIKKVGPNTQIFNASLQYTGDTIVEGGTLRLITACSNSPMIHVAAGATLETLNSTPLALAPGQLLTGNGTVTGAVVVAASGRIRPGDGAGILTFGLWPHGSGLDLSAGGIVEWELAANATGNPGTDFDQIVLTAGTLTLGGASTLSLQFTNTATAPDSSDPFWQESRTWQIISATNVVSNFAAIENGDHPAGSFSTSVDTNGVWLMFTPSSPRPRITAISGAGTGGVTVSYTNTLPGTNYVLSYSTNLGVMNWFAAGNKTAAGASDSQTDGTATNSQRHYRVHYSTP